MADRPGPLDYGSRWWLQLSLRRLPVPLCADHHAGRLLLQHSRRDIVWRGFTFDNYVKAWNNASLIEALVNSLIDRLDRHHHLHGHRRLAGAGAVALPLSRQGRLSRRQGPADRHPRDLHGRGAAGLLQPASMAASGIALAAQPLNIIIAMSPSASPSSPSSCARGWSASTASSRKPRRTWAPPNGRPSGTSSCPS